MFGTITVESWLENSPASEWRVLCDDVMLSRGYCIVLGRSLDDGSAN